MVNGRVQEESEYQDAYAFLARAHALWPDLDPAVLALMPSITAPATLLAPDRFEALVDQARDALADAAGPAYAASTSNDLTSLLSDLDAANAAVSSADARAATENDMATASAALAARSADYATAREAIADMRARISPFVASNATYGVFDAAIILLREGVEALLVIAALLAFLAKTGNAAKQRWIWTGGAAGVLASVVIAIAITAAFSASESAGAQREILEGLTGLFAAAMLVYMSGWLHSKSSLSSWQRYINEKSDAALASGSLFGLSQSPATLGGRLISDSRPSIGW